MNLFRCYKNSLDSPTPYTKNQIENKFSYAVHDFLEDKKDNGEYNLLREKYPQQMQQLEKIAEDCFSFENSFVENFLNKNLEEDSQELLSGVFRIYRLIYAKEES